MSNNRFRNWQNSVDIDYLSLYMKTWFAFLSTVQELYPEVVNGSGDGSVVSVYKENVGIPTKFVEAMLPHIEKVHFIGNSLIPVVIPLSYYVNYFNTNKDFLFKKTHQLNTYNNTSDGSRDYHKSSIKIQYRDKISGDSNPNLLITLKSNSPKFNTNLSCNHITFNIELSKFIDENNNDGNKIFKSKDDCIELIENSIKNHLHSVVNVLEIEDDEKEERKGYCNGLLVPFIQYLRQEFSNEDLFTPLPLKGFSENYDVNSNKRKILTWFIAFNYQLRNLLFHSLIDPFSPEWLRIFKHAYLALKELVEHNILQIETQNPVEV